MSGKIVVLLFIVISLLQSCNTTEPPPPQEEKPTLTLTLEDASSIEAWIKLTTNNLQFPATVTLKQNNTVTQDIILSNADTVIYIDSLLPKITYTFQAITQSSNQFIKSNELNVTTMDTTSHNFTWQTWTFGEHSSSVLNDVAIIDENNIWAVGSIYMNDSLGNPDPNAYNAIHWDGTEWIPFRIMFYTICGQQSRTPYPASAIFAFNENEVWIGMDGRQIAKIEGTTQVKTICPPFSMVINKIWGTSSSDLYVVGNNGNIAWYNGSVWTRIESGTELNINDIWGDYNEKTGEWEILAVAANVNSSVERTLIKISNNSSQIISSSLIEWSLRTVWFKSSKKYYVAGSGIYEKHNLTEELWLNNPLDITTYYTNRIRGNSINDVIGVGAFGDVVHFNGWKWKNDYSEPNLSFGSYLSVDTKYNIVVAVGLEYSQAVILIGKK